MYIGGVAYAGASARTAASDLAAEGSGAGDERPHLNERPGYFRTISSISHASLAAAYQSMRAHDLSMVPVDPPLAGEPNREVAVAPAVITSGAGIPVAMSAYAEIMSDVDAA